MSVKVVVRGSFESRGGPEVETWKLGAAEVRSRKSRAVSDSKNRFEGVIGVSPAMDLVFQLMECAANSDVSVLISGATGTGKEVIARAVHRRSPRRTKAFLPINCAAMPESLLESELFGHRRGAFTGAEREKKGIFLEAAGGTVFLDEVGETSASFQAKLLRVLQESEVRPVGAERAFRVDVRLIAATNRDLEEEVRAGRFRKDLYFRLVVFPIELPPLCERHQDILPLANCFLHRYSAREGKLGCALSNKAEEALLAYSWPGNIRELENEIQRAVVLAKPDTLVEPNLFSRRVRREGYADFLGLEHGGTLREATARYESVVIRRMLCVCDGSRTKTAKRLGLTREGLYKAMRRLNIQ